MSFKGYSCNGFVSVGGGNQIWTLYTSFSSYNTLKLINISLIMDETPKQQNMRATTDEN